MTNNVRFPAEWEPQAAILIAWPNADTDWAERLAEVEDTYIALVAAIVRFQRVVICVADDDVETYAEMRLRSNRVDGPHHEVDRRACGLQRLGQRQAALEVPSAHAGRGVHPNAHMAHARRHVQAPPPGRKAWRTGTPALASAALAPAGVCSVK